MLNRKDKFAHAILRPINPAAIIILGIYTMVWGAWLLNPGTHVFTTAALYDALTILPEEAWGANAMLCGSITTYGALRRKYKPLVIGALVACWHWSLIGTFYFMGDWVNTGGITSFTFAIYAAFIWLNIRVNHRANKPDSALFTD